MSSPHIERGPHGDHGQMGDQGKPGLDGRDGASGRDGMVGQVGERGRAGDTGQAGATGKTGQVGSVGLTGDTGQTGDTGDTGLTGSTGPVGERGKTGFTRKQVLALFLFLTFALTLLAWRSEVNAGNIDENLRVSCEEDAVIATNFNAVLDQAIADTKASSTPRTDAQTQERIALYRAAKVQSPPC